MIAHGVGMALMVLPALMLVSCSELAAGFSVLAANRHFEEGRIHDAIAGYLRHGDQSLEGLTAYNLANAFMALGEFDSAEPLFRTATEAGSVAVAASAWFNLGTALYARGDFPAAASAFRRSLEVQPSDREVCRAYELALNASRAVQSVSDREQARFQTSRGGGDQSLFGMAMPAPRPFFVPGGGSGAAGVDH
jgi:Ca-activated chloride channel homolog